MDSPVRSVGHITGFSSFYYRYELQPSGEIIPRLINRPDISVSSEEYIQALSASIRLTTKPDPNERILYYMGHTRSSMEPMFGGPLADPTKDYVVHLRDMTALEQYMIAANVVNIDRWKDRLIVSYRPWGGEAYPLAGNAKPYVNVGTIGHIDYAGYRREVLSLLQQTIRDINNGR